MRMSCISDCIYIYAFGRGFYLRQHTFAPCQLIKLMLWFSCIIPVAYNVMIIVYTAHTQRLLKLQSILRCAPSYRTLELQLIQWQERELFEYFVVVSLKKKPTKNSYTPEVTYQFPKVNNKYSVL